MYFPALAVVWGGPFLPLPLGGRHPDDGHAAPLGEQGAGRHGGGQ